MAVSVGKELGVSEIVFVNVPLTVLEGVCVGERVDVEVRVVVRELLKEGVKVFVGCVEVVAVVVEV